MVPSVHRAHRETWAEGTAQMADKDVQLPQYFPLTVKECNAVAGPFFECFNEHSKMRESTDRDAGRRAMAECKAEAAAYVKCMDQHASKSKHYM